MQEGHHPGARLRQRACHVALFVALAVVPVLAVNSLATATAASDGGTDPTAAGPTGGRPALTDTQHQCLSDQGVTLPAGGADGAKPELTGEQRRQLREAGAACGLGAMNIVQGPPGARGHGTGLTDAQRQCLADQGVTLPVRSADHPHSSASAEQRDVLRQAATTCGLPERGHRRGGDAKI